MRLNLVVVLAAACTKAYVPPARIAAPTDRAVVFVAEEPSEQQVAALWQGFEHRWRYNHRINRIGSILQLEASGCSGGDPSCSAAWKNTAASGMGPDKAKVRTYATLISAPKMAFGSATQELLLSGAEGEAIVAEAIVEVPIATIAGNTHAALLNGFDLAALESADKFIEFALHVGEPEVGNGVARVPVTAAATMNCSSAECPMADVVDYSLTVAVLVVSGPPERFQVFPEEVKSSYGWDKKAELPADIGRVVPELEPPTTPHTYGIAGFSLALNGEHHMVDLGVHVENDPSANLRFQNWSRGMKLEKPPQSLTAFKDEGTAEWTANLVTLAFEEASIVPMFDEGSIRWGGWGKSALTEAAERPSDVQFFVKSGMPPDSGFVLAAKRRDAEPFVSTVRMLEHGRKAASLRRYCDEAPEPPSAQQALEMLSVFGKMTRRIEDMSAAVTRTPQPDGIEPLSEEHIALGRNVAPPDAQGGGTAYYRGKRKPQIEVQGEDWWWLQDRWGLQLTGKLLLPREADHWNGEGWTYDGALYWEADEVGQPARGKISRGLKDATQVSARLKDACGQSIKVEALFVAPNDSCDEPFSEATVTLGKTAYEIVFDESCAGCAVVDDEEVCPAPAAGPR